MKKRVFMRKRRGETKRNIGISLVIIVVMSSILGFVTQTVSPQIAKAATAAENDLKRRQLHTLRECTSKQIINEGVKEIKVYNDLFDKDINNDNKPKNQREYITVGFDREKDNGMMTCDTIIRQGVLALAPPALEGTSEKEIRDWYMLALTGNNLTKSKGEPFIPGNITLFMNSLVKKIKAAEDAIASPSAKLQQERFFPLAQMCYELYEEPNQDRELKDDDAESFYIPGTGYFYRKSSDQVKKSITGFIDGGGAGTRIGDVNLNFTLGPWNGFDVTKHDFYPIGADISKTNGYEGYSGTTGSIVDCNFIYKNRTIALAGVTPGDNGKINAPGDITSSIDTIGVGDTTEGTGEDSPPPQCQIQGSLGWILNPICDIAIQSTTELGENIEEALWVTPLTQSTSSNTSGVFEAWKVFRDLANAMLVIVFLIAIFAQILPIEIDAYSVKKIMPKLVVAVIAIQASYFICQILVDLSNVAGGGIGALLEGVIGRLPEVARAGSESNPATLIFASVAGIGIASLFIGPVLLLLLGALMSLLTLFITIQARQVILIFLAILSPLAILAWILPNTESAAEKWWKNYTKLLLMYPIIAFILGGAKLAYYVMAGALTTSPTTTDATSVQQIMISFIPVIAFLMVPATFKMSGSILSAVNGAVSNKLGGVKGKVGGSDLYKNFRTGQKEKALLKMSDRKGIMRMASKVRAGETLGGFGRVGKRQLDAKVKAARQSELGNIQAGWEENGFENADLGKIADAYLSGQDSIEVKGQKIKVDERTGQAAIAYLGANGGDKEIADMSAKHIFNGGQDVKKGTRFNKRMDQSEGSAFDKINRGLILGGAKAKQARSNPQLMKKEGAFTDQATVDSIVGLKGPTGQVAAQIAFGDQSDPTKDPAQNAAATQASRQKNIDNILAITSDRDAARAIDAKTAVAYRDEAVAWLTAEEAAGRGVLLEDGSRALDHIKNSISDQGAVIADPDNVVKAQW